MKLNKEQIGEIKTLSEEGMTLRELGKKLQVSASTIRYHLDKNKVKENYKKWYSSLTKEKRNQIFRRDKEKVNAYKRKRYKEDEEFRRKCIERATNWRKNKLKPIEEVVKGGNENE